MAGDAADEVAADFGEFFPRRVVVRKVSPKLGRSGRIALLDTEAVVRHWKSFLLVGSKTGATGNDNPPYSPGAPKPSGPRPRKNTGSVPQLI